MDDARADADAAVDRAGVTVRELRDAEEAATAAHLAAEIWGTPNGSIVEAGLLVALAHSGNPVTAAFDPEGRMLGLTVGWLHGPAADPGGPESATPAPRTLHSHLAGVAPGRTGGGIGLALKLHQRAWCLARGVTAMTWTFDPLVARNAHFNLALLGAVVTEYLPDHYGRMDDAINRGEPSDRVTALWCLPAPLPRAAEPEPLPPILLDGGDGGDGGEPSIRPAAAPLAGPACALSIPPDIETLRRTTPARAGHWRLALREAMTGLLADGWRVAGFATGAYLLRKDAP